MRKVSPLVLALLVLSVIACAPSYAADLYHGRVVDADTGEPLVGAVLTVVWFRSPILGFEQTRDFLSAQETVTDSEGKFSLHVSPGIDWNPFTYVRKEPKIVIYQPGYEPTWAVWLARNKFKTTTDFAEALKKGVTVKLQELRTKNQLAEFADLGVFGLPPDVRIQQVPKLIHAINVQRKRLRVKPIY